MDAFRRWAHIPEKMFDVDLHQDEQVEFEGVLSLIRNMRDQSSVNKALSHDELLVFNRFGEKKPIFWCFNNWAEPYLFAYQLDENQPLIAAQSPHGVEKSWVKKARYTEPLAKRYLESATQLFNRQDFIYCGNCQGAPVVESMCIQLSRQCGIFPQLITIDYIAKRRYQGPILMLFGSESPFNPFNYERDPLPYWKKRLKSFQWKHLHGPHGTYLKEPTIVLLKEIVSAHI
ncbi:hypothetical protein [Desulfovibrio inopinatus]|uniref:hypothetical protein n=1 Tax=Desulfovibrio inopinatus TaxID=102109 RepID=UPI00040FD33B|nr:hypothetical protein [Desulfovibrio inopinatus]